MKMGRPGPRLEPGSGDPQSPRITDYPTLAGCTLFHLLSTVFNISPRGILRKELQVMLIISCDPLHCTITGTPSGTG